MWPPTCTGAFGLENPVERPQVGPGRRRHAAAQGVRPAQRPPTKTARSGRCSTRSPRSVVPTATTRAWSRPSSAGVIDQQKAPDFRQVLRPRLHLPAVDGAQHDSVQADRLGRRADRGGGRHRRPGDPVPERRHHGQAARAGVAGHLRGRGARYVWAQSTCVDRLVIDYLVNGTVPTDASAVSRPPNRVGAEACSYSWTAPVCPAGRLSSVGRAIPLVMNRSGVRLPAAAPEFGGHTTHADRSRRVSPPPPRAEPASKHLRHRVRPVEIRPVVVCVSVAIGCVRL